MNYIVVFPAPTARTEGRRCEKEKKCHLSRANLPFAFIYLISYGNSFAMGRNKPCLYCE